VIFVDGRIGRNNLTGRSEVIAGVEGPKETIRGGLDECRDGEELVVKEGRYGEHMDISGRGVRATVRGHVVLSGTERGAGEGIATVPTNRWRRAEGVSERLEDVLSNTTRGGNSNEWTR
jgi:hypothetical protein